MILILTGRAHEKEEQRRRMRITAALKYYIVYGEGSLMDDKVVKYYDVLVWIHKSVIFGIQVLIILL